MATATAYCPSNTRFHQHSLTTTRTQYTSVPRRTTLSPSTSFSSNIPISHIEQTSITKLIKSDENNNENEINDTPISDTDDMLYIASDDNNDDDDDDIDNLVDDDNETIINNTIEIEQYLISVGLRSKTKKSIVSNPNFPPLSKRLAGPVCLLPLPKYSERVRQALYIRMPSLKYLSITYDIELFCSTDDSAKAQSLLPRSAAQTRALSLLNKSPKKHKLTKTDFISMATTAFRLNTNRTSRNHYIRSVLECNVVLDRLEQSAIDLIMLNSIANEDKSTIQKTKFDQSSHKTRRSVKSSKTESLKSIEKSPIKRKTSITEQDKIKRFKSIENTPTVTKTNNSSLLTYQRIYLKCFVCSKRQYVDAQTTDSDVLHTHWLEHDGNLSLNIYDSEIDKILTRVVEFFKLPRQHLLEGQIKTVFIYNSKEIRSTSTTNLSSDDSYIIID